MERVEPTATVEPEAGLDIGSKPVVVSSWANAALARAATAAREKRILTVKIEGLKIRGDIRSEGEKTRENTKLEGGLERETEKVDYEQGVERGKKMWATSEYMSVSKEWQRLKVTVRQDTMVSCLEGSGLDQVPGT